jgi:hypothetical protein
MHEVGTGRQNLGRRRSLAGLEAPLGLRKPVARAVGIAGKVRHEEHVEMAQMVGEVFAGQHQVGGKLPVLRRHQSGQLTQCTRGRGALCHRADTANTRHDDQGIFGHTPKQHGLESPVQR